MPKNEQYILTIDLGLPIMTDDEDVKNKAAEAISRHPFSRPDGFSVLTVPEADFAAIRESLGRLGIHERRPGDQNAPDYIVASRRENNACGVSAPGADDLSAIIERKLTFSKQAEDILVKSKIIMDKSNLKELLLDSAVIRLQGVLIRHPDIPNRSQEWMQKRVRILGPRSSREVRNQDIKKQEAERFLSSSQPYVEFETREILGGKLELSMHTKEGISSKNAGRILEHLVSLDIFCYERDKIPANNKVYALMEELPRHSDEVPKLKFTFSEEAAKILAESKIANFVLDAYAQQVNVRRPGGGLPPWNRGH